MGQDLPAYLDGLLYANPLNYWIMLCGYFVESSTPQNRFSRRTDIYHLSSNYRLYFKLAMLELDQIAHNGKLMSEEGQDMGWNEFIG